MTTILSVEGSFNRARTNVSEGTRVSVCIPTRNRVSYLREAIASVLAQSYEDFVLIISDNASTDDTKAMVASLEDDRIVYSPLDHDIGLVANHERCFELSETDYVVVLPDDDLLRPNMLRDAVGVLDASPSVALVHSAFDVIDAQGHIMLPGVDYLGTRGGEGHENGNDFIRHALGAPIRVHVSTAVFRRKALPDVIFDLRDFPPVDLGLMLRIGLAWDFFFLRRSNAAIRVHQHSFSATHAGPLNEGGYVDTPECIANVTQIKRRFLDEHAQRLPNHPALSNVVRRAHTLALLNSVARRTLPDRDRSKTVGLLLEAQRSDRRTILEPAAWRLLVGSLLGPAATARIKQRRAAAAEGARR